MGSEQTPDDVVMMNNDKSDKPVSFLQRHASSEADLKRIDHNHRLSSSNSSIAGEIDNVKNATPSSLHVISPPIADIRKLSRAKSQIELSTDPAQNSSFASSPDKYTATYGIKNLCNIHYGLRTLSLEKTFEGLNEALSHHSLVQSASAVREVGQQISRSILRQKISTVMLVSKVSDKSLVYLTRQVTEWLMLTPREKKSYGLVVYVDNKFQYNKSFNSKSLTDNPIVSKYKLLQFWTPELCQKTPAKFDLVITLGGDGTVLYTSWLFQQVVPPILPFALGSLGFLTNFSFQDYQKELTSVFENGMRVNLRMRFRCTVFRAAERMRPQVYEVLNEVVIDRGPSPWVSELELWGDEQLITVVHADGLILSTPTGSTAYSLSAGGSLVNPEIPATLITPICPHTLSFRPMILPDSMVLRVVIPARSRAAAYVSFDGRARLKMKQGDYVEICSSSFPFPTVVRTRHEWIDNISQTLRWNLRKHQRPFDSDESEEEAEPGFSPILPGGRGDEEGQ